VPEQRLLQEKLDDSFIKMLLVNMVLIEKTEKQLKKTSVNLAGKASQRPYRGQKAPGKVQGNKIASAINYS
jgi:hypothetical protein